MRSVTLGCIGLLSRFKDSSEQCEVDCLNAVGCEEVLSVLNQSNICTLGVPCRKGCLLLLVFLLVYWFDVVFFPFRMMVIFHRDVFVNE